MIYNILAIFDEVQLMEVETILNQLTLVTQADKNQMVKAVEDYQYLTDSLQTTRGLTKQVMLFLLDKVSITPEGIESFLAKLETWLVIVENKKEQRIYAEVINTYKDSLYYYDKEILALRFSLLDSLRELEHDKAEKKARRQRDSWERDNRLTQYEAPMQYQEGYDEYELMMEVYGQSFESPDSLFNNVPNLKDVWNYEQPSYEEAYQSLGLR